MLFFFFNLTLLLVQSNFTLLNDFGTNHLSKDEGPLLYIYKVLTGVWSIMLLVWICNWIQFRKVGIIMSLCACSIWCTCMCTRVFVLEYICTVVPVSKQRQR